MRFENMLLLSSGSYFLLCGQSQFPCERQHSLRALDERSVDHAAIDGVGAYTLLSCDTGSRDDLQRVSDLGVRWTEDCVGNRNLCGVNCGFSEKAKAAGALGLTTIAVRIVDVGKCAVVRPDSGFAGGEADRQLDCFDRRR